MMFRLRKVLLLTFCVCGMLWLFCAVNVANVVASGGWISGGASGVSVSGSGNGGGNCSGDSEYYDLACTGYSWIFYKYIGGEENSHAIYFRRDGYMSDFGLGVVNNIIDKSCSEHGNSEGFWHLGYNMKGMEYGTGIYVFGDAKGGVKGLSSWNVVYSTGPSTWGHAMTFDYNSIPTYYKQNGGYKTYSNGSLNHVIYMKKNGSYIPMYKAVKFGTESDVLKDYKAAYKNINGRDYNGSILPGNVYAFCSWGSSGGYEIKKQNVQIEDNTNIGGETTAANGVTGEVSVSQSNPDPNTYKFIGWKTVNTHEASQNNNNLKTSNIMTRVSSDGGFVTYLDYSSIRGEGEVYCGSDTPSENGVYCANGEGSRRIYNTIMANVDSEQARMVYAYYARKYGLTVNAGVGTKVTVNRVGSRYSGTSETNNLGSGTVLYRDDSLRICVTAAQGYVITGLTVNGNNVLPHDKYCYDPEYYTVTGATEIIATAEPVGSEETFEINGMAEVFDENQTASSSTEYTISDEALINVEGCPYGGCKITFRFSLKSMIGTGESNYEIYRVTGGGFPNYTVGNIPVKSGQWAPGDSQEVYMTNRTVSLDSKLCYVMKYDVYSVGDKLGQVAACARIESLEIEGKVSVSGSVDGEVGWASVNRADSFEIQDCSIDGCEARFDHRLKLVNGAGETTYTISRTSNWSEIDEGVVTGGYVTLYDGSNVKVASDVVNMRPGVKVCETLKFLKNGNGAGLFGLSVNMNFALTSITACVLAGGDAPDLPDNPPDDLPDNPPDDPQSDTKEVYLKVDVKNDDIDDEYKKNTWAKPTDNVEFRTTYNPVLQYTYGLVVDGMRINSGGEVWNDSGATLQSLFNNNSGMANWNNAYAVSWENTVENHILEVGRTDEDVSTNGYGRSIPFVGLVRASDVGTVLEERAEINMDGNIDIQTTPSKVHFSVENKKIIADIMTSNLYSLATVKVPYNFKNSTSVTDDSGIVYAGENKTVKYTVQVGKKYNSVTKGNYATPVTMARWGLMIKYGDGEWSEPIEYGSGALNYAPYQYNGINVAKESVIDVPDVAAGTQVCVKSWMWPANSGAEDNMQTSNFSGTVVSDNEVCFMVAKKPSFQVWGGDLVIDGDAKAAVSEKKKLAGYGDGNYIFGSWVEQGLFVTGNSTGIASGASLGYAINNGDGTLWPNSTPLDGLGNNADIGEKRPGGGTSNDFCVRSILSFANDECGSGKIGFSVDGSSNDSEHLSLLADFAQLERDEELDLNVDKERSYYYQNGDVEITGATIKKGNTKIVHVSGKVNIRGNIIYDDSQKYSSMNEMPKLIIYAGGDIVIDCTVSRVDAILITEGSVSTCSDINVNAAERSTQLKINGAVIANKLALGRTYGAATGANSMVPAEILNYDASMYLWANKQTDVTSAGAGKLVESYVKELSPRY